MAGPVEEFAHELLAGTKRESLEWRRPPGLSRLQLTGEKGKVVLERVSGDVVRLTLTDSQGQVVGKIESDPARSGPWQPWESALLELFPTAELQAKGTTKVLKDLREEFGLVGQSGSEDDIPF